MKMLFRYVLLLFIIVLLSNTWISAGNRHHNISDTKYKEYATQFSCIKRLVIKKDKKIIGLGSCVIIDNTTALTCAHMMDQENISVYIQDRSEIKITKVICHKNFDRSFAKFDIAIIKFDKYDFENIVYPELYNKTDEVGKIVAVGGYGLTGTGITGHTSSDSSLRVGTNIVDSIINNLLVCSFSKNNPSLLEFCITPGDSGGGLFIDGKLAGINSCVLADDKNPNGSYGDESGHTRVSDFIGWIQDNK